jgi:hypothetical protein
MKGETTMAAMTSFVSNKTSQAVGTRRRAPTAIRDMAAALASAMVSKVRAEFEANQLGPERETVIGRGTGARI